MLTIQALFSPIIYGQTDLDLSKGELLYETALSKEEDLRGWIMEGPGTTTFDSGWMHMYSEEEAGHHVLWCPEDFPASFIAEWELQNIELDAGLCIIFFAAKGNHGEDIFDPSLKKRDGVFSSYTKSDIDCYHISYYANTPPVPNRAHSHLRKNSGFIQVQTGEAPLDPQSSAVHKATLIKEGEHITMFIDDRKIIDWIDDGKTYGPVLQDGKIGFRQMQWTHFRYRNFKVWSISDKNRSGLSWPRHTIDNSSSGADGVKLADINGDGQLDIATGWEEGGVTKMYLNPGKESVKNYWPNVEIGKTPGVEDAVFVDMNADGILEVVSCTENRSEKIYVHWAPQDDLLDGGKWSQEILPASDGKMMWMYAEPVQLDDRFGVDLIAAGKGDHAAIGWFEAPESGRNLQDWRWHEISPMGWVMSIFIRDMDQDQDMDIIVTDRRGALQSCRWLENPGVGQLYSERWTNHLIGAKGLEVMFMSMYDINADGTEEVIVAERTKESIRIYSRGSEWGSWQEQIIPLPKWTGHAKSVEVGDLNGDEIPDFVISTNTDNHEDKCGLIWLDGSHLNHVTDSDFQPIATYHRAKYDKVELIDLDQDGDLDILICEENYGDNSQGLGVIWYENTLKNR